MSASDLKRTLKREFRNWLAKRPLSTQSGRSVNSKHGLLGILHDNNKAIISTNFLDKRPNNLDVRVRSIMSVLFYLSQTVRVPDEHKAVGLITVTKKQNGETFNWDDTPAGKHFSVHSSKERPANAYISVPHRGYWFYIANDDLETKSSFLLLQQLFNLQAGQAKAVGPTLTLPVGGR